MTKKDYVLIASVIREVSENVSADKNTLRMLVSALGTELQRDNPRFSGRTFEIACNVTT